MAVAESYFPKERLDKSLIVFLIENKLQILCLFKKKKKIYEKGLKSLKKACFVIIPFLYHFVIILSLTFLI